jgi:hypothetical protein
MPAIVEDFFMFADCSLESGWHPKARPITMQRRTEPHKILAPGRWLK